MREDTREGTKRFLRSGLLWAIIALVIVAFIIFVPQLQGEYFSQKVPADERPALVNEYRRTWAQIIGGFGLLLGLYFTWRRIEISQQELESTRDQQVTERFTRAIDQLGATDDEGKNRMEIRLGGIYALERIAWDSFAMESSPGRDYSTVMKVLTAYVRENTRQAFGSPQASPESASMSNEAPADAEPRRPTADIQAILDVLRRTQAHASDEQRTTLDLREANLRGADLRGALLQDANFQGADLRGADLRGAYLRGADLQEALLQNALLRGVHFQEALLQDANFQGADLRGADLQGAYFPGALLPGAHLQEALLQGANLRGANLQGANLGGALLHGADLQDALLQEALLLEDDLLGANLQGATMPDGSKHP